jgi:hypothetical protein
MVLLLYTSPLKTEFSRVRCITGTSQRVHRCDVTVYFKHERHPNYLRQGQQKIFFVFFVSFFVVRVKKIKTNVIYQWNFFELVYR